MQQRPYVMEYGTKDELNNSSAQRQAEKKMARAVLCTAPFTQVRLARKRAKVTSVTLTKHFISWLNLAGSAELNELTELTELN